MEAQPVEEKKSGRFNPFKKLAKEARFIGSLMKAATPKNKNRTQSVAITAADISQDIDTKMNGIDVELVEAEKDRLMSVGDPDMQPIVTDEELPKREDSRLDRSLNSSIVGPAVVGQDQWQRKPYCQICFTKFSVTLR